MQPFAHLSVLAAEVVVQANLVSPPPLRILDCTLGGGGHAEALLRAFPRAQLIGMDRDPAAIEAASQRLAPFRERFLPVHAPFSTAARALRDLAQPQVDFVLADLGVSSHQLDAGERGFSFRANAPLDMRMDPTTGQTALELLQTTDAVTLANVLFRLGEEKRSRALARAILEDRPQTTAELHALCGRVVRASRDGIDPATRTFQALRMWVNGELEEVTALVHQASELIRPGGVFAAISFHSLEDRAIKHGLRAAARSCVCPPGLPQCACSVHPTFEVLTRRAVRPGPDELADNRRARSARLRAARRLEAPA